MNVVIIQARMGSTRLPGKVLLPLHGIPLIKYQISRVSEAKLIDKIIVATSNLKQDDVIYNFCMQNNFICFRGSENNVLKRYTDAAIKYNAKVIIRLTADCPFSDPILIDKSISTLLENNLDYLANTVPPETSKFPDGSDVEIFTIDALKKANSLAVSKLDREHVTFFFWKGDSSKLFKTQQLSRIDDGSDLRFTVDYPEDYQLAKLIAKKINENKILGDLEFIIDLLRKNPEMVNINKQYSFGDGWK